MTQYSVCSIYEKTAMLVYFTHEALELVTVQNNTFQRCVLMYSYITGLRKEKSDYKFTLVTREQEYVLYSLYITQLFRHLYYVCNHLRAQSMPFMCDMNVIQVQIGDNPPASIDFAAYPYFVLTDENGPKRFDQCCAQLTKTGKYKYYLAASKQQRGYSVDFTTTQETAMYLAAYHLDIVSKSRRLKAAIIMHENQVINVDYDKILQLSKEGQPPVARNLNRKNIIKSALREIEGMGYLDEQMLEAQRTKENQRTLEVSYRLLDYSKSSCKPIKAKTVDYQDILNKKQANHVTPQREEYSDEYSEFSSADENLEATNYLKEIEEIRMTVVNKAMHRALGRTLTQNDLKNALLFFSGGVKLLLYDVTRLEFCEGTCSACSDARGYYLLFHYYDKQTQLFINSISDEPNTQYMKELRALEQYRKQEEAGQKRFKKYCKTIFLEGWVGDINDGFMVILDNTKFMGFVESCCVLIGYK